MTPRKPMPAAGMNERISCSRPAVPCVLAVRRAPLCALDGSGTFQDDKAIARAIMYCNFRLCMTPATMWRSFHRLLAPGVLRRRKHHVPSFQSASNTPIHGHDLHLCRGACVGPCSLSLMVMVRSFRYDHRSKSGAEVF